MQEGKGLSEEGVEIPATVDNIFAPKLTFIYNRIIGEKFEGCCLRKDNLLIIELKWNRNNFFFILYELDTCSEDLNTAFTQVDCSFKLSKLIKNADKEKHRFSGGYGIEFDACFIFSLSNNQFGKNVFLV